MKKSISLLITVLLAIASVTPAFAHCHGRKAAVSAAPAAYYDVCNVLSCDTTGLHIHDNQSYLAHYYGDGHDYHGYCAIEDCILTGYHEHGGAYCFAYTSNGGLRNSYAGCYRY